MNRGWVKLWRKALDNPDLEAFDAMGLWCRLMLMASRQERSPKINGVRVQLERGQVAVVLSKLAEQGGMERKRMRVLLGKLRAEHMLDWGQAPHKAFTVITICNYDEYQHSEEHEEQAEGQGRAKQGPTEGPTKGLRRGDSEKQESPIPTGVVPHAAQERDDDKKPGAAPVEVQFLTRCEVGGMNPATVAATMSVWKASIPPERFATILANACRRSIGNAWDYASRAVGHVSNELEAARHAAAATPPAPPRRRADVEFLGDVAEAMFERQNRMRDGHVDDTGSADHRPRLEGAAPDDAGPLKPH